MRCVGASPQHPRQGCDRRRPTWPWAAWRGAVCGAVLAVRCQAPVWSVRECRHGEPVFTAVHGWPRGWSARVRVGMRRAHRPSTGSGREGSSHCRTSSRPTPAHPTREGQARLHRTHYPHALQARVGLRTLDVEEPVRSARDHDALVARLHSAALRHGLLGLAELELALHVEHIAARSAREESELGVGHVCHGTKQKKDS